MLQNSCINRINHKCVKTRLLVTHWWHHIISKESTEVVQLHFKASDRLAETQQVAVSRRHESSHICWFIRVPRVMFIAVVTRSSLHGYPNPKLAAQWWVFRVALKCDGFFRCFLVVFDPRNVSNAYPGISWGWLAHVKPRCAPRNSSNSISPEPSTSISFMISSTSDATNKNRHMAFTLRRHKGSVWGTPPW